MFFFQSLNIRGGGHQEGMTISLIE